MSNSSRPTRDHATQGKRRKMKRRLKKLARRPVQTLAAPILILLYLIPSLFVLASRFRFVIDSRPDRIGHLAAEFDCFLKEMALGIRPSVRPVCLLSAAEVANPCLLECWGERIGLVHGRVARALLRPFLYFPYLRIELLETVTALGETASYPSVLAKWGSRAPLLALEREHEMRGEEALRKLGIPEDAWFVCVHSREGGYSPRDEHIHAYRNSAIGDYGLAMEAIVERGGWCVRMGDATMAPLPETKGVVDYARSSLKSDWMDIFLCARTRFFLGNTSGLCIVSTIFGRPSALANMAPLAAAYPVGASDIGIPMLLERSSGEVVPFGEALSDSMADFRWADLYRENGLRTVNNSPEEIRDLAVEMLDRLEGKPRDDERAERLQQAFRDHYRPGHYTYGAASRMGSAFLEKYAHLI